MSGKIMTMLVLPTVSKQILKPIVTPSVSMLPLLASQLTRGLSTKSLSPSVTFLTNGSTKHLRSRPDLSNYSSEGRPLTVLLCWLMAKNNAVKKYAQFYIDQGFDVLTIQITPWQLLMPKKVEPIILNEILPTLLSSDHERKLIHGFSVGGYVFARMLKHMQEDPNGEELMRSMKGQIWDSVVDVNGVSIGVSKSVFMNSPVFQKGLQNYIDFHMKALYNVATKYYFGAHEYFYNKPLKAPSLFLCSEIDQISTMDVIQAVQKEWMKKGIVCDTKTWANTGHVGHMKAYPDEYKTAVRSFLDKNGMKPSLRIVTERRSIPNIRDSVIPDGYPNVVYTKAI